MRPDVLKKVLIAIAAVWGVAAVCLMLLPRLPASIDYKSVLIEQIEARTGRQAYIDGEVSMRMFPSPEITAGEVRVANIEGAPSADVIRARRAVFKVDGGALLSRKVRVTGIELSQPKIYLDVLADGRKSWDFQPVGKPGKNRKAAFDGFVAKDATILYRKGEAQLMLTGDLSYDRAGERPVIEASLKAGKVDLEAFLGPPGSGPDQVRDGGKRWSEEPIDISVLRGADGKIEIQADEIRYRRYLFAKPSLTAGLSNGRLRIEKASAGLFGGAATMTGMVDAREVPALKLEVTLSRASVDKALSDWADTPFASGEFGMTASVSASGNSQYAMVRSLSGTALIEAKDGVVRGFDAAQLGNEMSQLDQYGDFLDLAITALNGGQSRYTRITGGLAFDGGVGELKDFKATLDGARASAQGRVDLPDWSVDMAVSLAMTGKQNSKVPPVALTLNGPIGSPEQKTHLGAVGKYVGKKLAKTVIDDVLGEKAPEEMPRQEQREKAKKLASKLVDKIERRRERVRREPEPESEPYYDEPYDQAYREPPSYGANDRGPRDDGDQADDRYQPDDRYGPPSPPPPPSYRLEPGPRRQAQSPGPYQQPADRYAPDDQDYQDEEQGYQQGYGPGPYDEQGGRGRY